jgi:hypothetical protein
VQLIDTTSVQPSVKGKRKAYEGDQRHDDQPLRAYQWRTRAAQALIASAYLAGVNTRRVRRALTALFGGAIGKDIVSRAGRKVKGDWDAWNARSLAEEPIVRLVLDGTVVRVRLDRKATAISLLVVIAARAKATATMKRAVQRNSRAKRKRCFIRGSTSATASRAGLTAAERTGLVLDDAAARRAGFRASADHAKERRRTRPSGEILTRKSLSTKD